MSIDREIFWGNVVKNVPTNEIKKSAANGLLDAKDIACLSYQCFNNFSYKLGINTLRTALHKNSYCDRQKESLTQLLFSLYNFVGDENSIFKTINSNLSPLRTSLVSAGSWWRLAAIHAESLDYEKTMFAFRKGLRLAPNAPESAHIEVVILLTFEDYEKAIYRSAFWLRRLNIPACFDFIRNFLTVVSLNPVAASDIYLDNIGPQGALMHRAYEFLFSSSLNAEQAPF